MTFRYTPIHRELGVTTQEMTWNLIDEAVCEKVLERTDLDWKSTRYERRETKKDIDELVKDVAAMANSGGGLIVLGVLDDHKTSAAIKVFEGGVALSEPEQRSYRQIVASNTRPAVTGLNFLVLQGPNGEAVTLIEIQPSLDAPHLVLVDKTRFVAPFRDGAHSAFMTERQLEAAYRRRLSERTSLIDRCEFLYDEAADNSYPLTRLCFVASAVPEIARPVGLGRPSRDDGVVVIKQAKAARSQLTRQRPSAARLSPLNDPSVSDDVFLNPRPGHERLLVRSDSVDLDPRHRSLCIAIHNDGSVSLAWTLGGVVARPPGQPNEASARFVESAIIDFTSLVAAAFQTLGAAGGYLLQCGLVYRGENPIILRRYDTDLQMDFDVGLTHPIKRFLPARQYLPAEYDMESLREIATFLSLDCVSQGGVSSLTFLDA